MSGERSILRVEGCQRGKFPPQQFDNIREIFLALPKAIEINGHRQSLHGRLEMKMPLPVDRPSAIGPVEAQQPQHALDSRRSRRAAAAEACEVCIPGQLSMNRIGIELVSAFSMRPACCESRHVELECSSTPQRKSAPSRI